MPSLPSFPYVYLLLAQIENNNQIRAQFGCFHHVNNKKSDEKVKNVGIHFRSYDFYDLVTRERARRSRSFAADHSARHCTTKRTKLTDGTNLSDSASLLRRLRLHHSQGGYF